MFTLQAAHQHAVARPLGAHTGGSRQDLDNDTYVTHALTASPGASEDGTGRGTPLVAACLVERDAKGADSDTKPGHLITTPAVAIRTANTGANGHGVAEDVTHTLDGAQGQAVAFDWQSGGDVRHNVSTEHTSALQCNQTPAVAFAQNTRDEVRRQVNGDGSISGALAAQPGMKQTSYVATPARVRRLTPVECERLQGFPDGWTDGQADSPRYRQLGNAVTVNVAEWIGRRIMEVAG
jgi:DNA (cytosine-5)-methyltransferase 1